MAALEGSKSLLKYFEEDLVVCESLDEFCDAAGNPISRVLCEIWGNTYQDVLGLLETIENPQEFLESAFDMLQQS